MHRLFLCDIEMGKSNPICPICNEFEFIKSGTPNGVFWFSFFKVMNDFSNSGVFFSLSIFSYSWIIPMAAFMSSSGNKIVALFIVS